LISAFFWDGIPGQVYDLADEQYVLLTSDAMLEELTTVLKRVET
jgi:predicted nucleic acid-binding protein